MLTPARPVIGAPCGAPCGEPTGVVGARMPLRVFFVCALPLCRRGLEAAIAAEPGMQWLGAATDATEAWSCAGFVPPDVVLVDERPGEDAAGIVTALRPRWPRARWAVMTTRLEPADVRRLNAAGAAALLHRSDAMGQVLKALHDVHRGVRAVSPRAAAEIAGTASQARPAADWLTPRERELLQMAALGLENRAIARSLGITVPTVKFHMSNILTKLGVSSRTAAVLAGLRLGIVVLDDDPARWSPPGVKPLAARALDAVAR